MESRIEATRRLQRENRWDEASRARDLHKQELRRQGLTRRAANDDSWNWMIAAFPPLELPRDSQPDDLIDIVDEILCEGGEWSFVVADWVLGMISFAAKRKRDGVANATEYAHLGLLNWCPQREFAYTGILALSKPRESLAMVEDRFKSTLAKLTVTHQDHWLCDEIRKSLAEIPRIRREL